MKSLNSRVATFVLIPLVCLLMSACCDEEVRFMVFVGNKTEEECEEAMKTVARGLDPDFVYICPGEQVTLCWHSDNASGVEITDLGTKGPNGHQVITPTSDKTYIATPLGDDPCPPVEVKIEIVDGPTPATVDANYNTVTKRIEFRVSELFMSEKIKAMDITALWEPQYEATDAKGNVYPVVCRTPPFLGGNHAEEVFFFEIKEPFLTTAFSRLIRAVGHWNFELRADCSPHRANLEPFFVYPFDLTLICPE